MARSIKVLHSDDPTPIAQIPFVVRAAGKELLLMKTLKGEWKSWEPQCPHQKASLMGVRPDEAGCIVCPLHRYRFCLEDGYETQGRGRLYLFPIKEVEHEVFVFL